jgi:hypothetical protein
MSTDLKQGLYRAVPAATNVLVTDDTLTVDLSEGRTISVPLAWYPRLVHAHRKNERDGD